MDFLNYREGGVIFYQFFLLSPLQCNCSNCKRLREFEEVEFSNKALEVILNSKEENS
jgi:hypothetical protein